MYNQFMFDVVEKTTRRNEMQILKFVSAIHPAYKFVFGIIDLMQKKPSRISFVNRCEFQVLYFLFNNVASVVYLQFFTRNIALKWSLFPSVIMILTAISDVRKCTDSFAFDAEGNFF